MPLSCSHSQPPGNGQIEARFVLRRAASELVDERAVDLLDVDATVLHRLDLVGDLQKLLRGGFRIGIRAWLNEFPMCDCSVELPRAEFVNQAYIQHRSVGSSLLEFHLPRFSFGGLDSQCDRCARRDRGFRIAPQRVLTLRRK